MRNVVVTGGSRGLGLGIAGKLAAAGYRVLAIARNMNDQLAETIGQVGTSQRGALHFVPFFPIIPMKQAELQFRADGTYFAHFITEAPQQMAFSAACRAAQGINFSCQELGRHINAAIGTDGVLAIMYNTQIEELVRVNTISPIVLTKYAVRSMMSEGGGRIVNVASVIGFTGYSGLSVYGATKASMIGFTRSLAREVGRLGVNVNAVAPGFIDTDMTQGLGDAQRAQVARRSALRRLADVDDVADAVEFLLGDKAKNITGTVLTVDAGSTA